MSLLAPTSARRDAPAQRSLQAVAGVSAEGVDALASPSLARARLGGGVVAERDGRIVGSNFVDERGPIRGLGPITVDPRAQGRGVGRRLMRAALERSRGAPGSRLLQDSFNVGSLSLYASLGFEVKEPAAVMSGTEHHFAESP